MSTITAPRVERSTQRWVVDPTRSTIEFRVPYLWGRKTAVGRFSRFDGAYTVAPDRRAIDLTIEADSLDTGNRLRDRHLREEDFFHVERHPHVRFTATSVTDAAPGVLRIAGELEAAGKKLPISIDAAVRQRGDELELEATTTVDQRLLGMTRSPLGMIRTPSTLHVRARLTRVPS
jgi:polyisoprenoid-binding protein YceI